MLPILKEHFDKQWIKEVHGIYQSTVIKNIKDFRNITFFRSPGTFMDWYKQCGVEDEDNYLEHLLYVPNMTIIHHAITSNLLTTNPIVLDWGAGAGLLSVFFAKLGIKCVNYDNLSQLGDTGPQHVMNFLDKINRTFGYDIKYETDYKLVIESLSKFNTLTASGIGVNIINADFPDTINYMMFDARSNIFSNGNGSKIMKHFRLCGSQSMIKVWKRKGVEDE